jgi:hypothetical protein
MEQLAPAASIFCVEPGASAQSLETSLNGVVDFGVPTKPSPKVAGLLPRLVTVMVFTAAALAEVCMPKSSSFGTKAKLASPCPGVNAPKVTDVLPPFAADAVSVPAAPPASTTSHSPPGRRELPQLVVKVPALVVSCRPSAAAEPRFRNVTDGTPSAENTSAGPESLPSIFVR